MGNARRRRFIAYFNGPPLKGSREALMRRTGLTKGRVSQLFDEDLPFGEVAARNLAERLGLPEDFFEHDVAAPAAEPADYLHDLTELLRDIARLPIDLRQGAIYACGAGLQDFKAALAESVVPDAASASAPTPSPAPSPRTAPRSGRAPTRENT